MTTSWLTTRLEQRKGRPAYETERLLLRITEEFVARMQAQNIKKSELARRMGVDKAVITRVLSADHNMTVRTLVSLASALGCRLNLHVENLTPGDTRPAERADNEERARTAWCEPAKGMPREWAVGDRAVVELLTDIRALKTTIAFSEVTSEQSARPTEDAGVVKAAA